MKSKKLPPIHPREILMEEFLVPLNISQYRLAKDVSVPPRRINEIARGQRAISADTALRLARYFGTSNVFGSIFDCILIWKLKRIF
jgi:addiction module HigA family antidote